MQGPGSHHRLMAIGLVVLVLAGVAALVGTDENEGALVSATDRLATQTDGDAREAAPVAQPSAARAPQPSPQPAAEPEFLDDEALIDDAAGFDPSPDADDAEEGEVTVIVPRSPSPAPAPPAQGQAPPGEFIPVN